MQDNPGRWFEIYVQDIERAKKFYESVLGIELQKLPPPESVKEGGAPSLEMYAFPMAPDKIGCGGALVKMPGVPSGGNSTVIYFASQDCAVEASKVVKAGGKIFKEKFSIAPYGSIALAFDTESNMFGLHSTDGDCCGDK